MSHSQPFIRTYSAISKSKLLEVRQAIKCYKQMQQSSASFDGHSFVAIIKACTTANLSTLGKLIHAHVFEAGLDLHAFVGNTLINFYAKCGSIDDARSVFGRLVERDLVSWGVMIGGYAEHGQEQEAFQLFYNMLQVCIEPDQVIFICILKACSGIAALNQGRLIHFYIIDKGLDTQVSLLNALIDMYAKCGSLENAHELFEKSINRDLITWNSIISGCILLGQGQTALDYYRRLLHEVLTPNAISLVSILKACSNIMALYEGRLIHGDIVESGLDTDVRVTNTLIDLYAKCCSLEDASSLFHRLPKHDIVAWNAFIAAHAQQEHGHKVVVLLQKMLEESVEPNRITFINTLKAVCTAKSLFQGRLIHAFIIQKNLEDGMSVANTLIDMYSKCGSFEDGLCLFHTVSNRDLVTWNVMFAGCADHGLGHRAVELLQEMQHGGVEPDEITYNCLLTANTESLLQGQIIHGHIVEHGFDSSIMICNSLIDMYATSKSLEEAGRVFSRISRKDTVTWNVMMEGYAMHGCGEETFNLYQQMLHVGLLPDQVTFLSALKACSAVASLQQGKLLHIQIVENGYASHTRIANSLIDMYAKCGSLGAACDVFDALPSRDTILWCSMITLCAQYSNWRLALQYFENMQQEGFNPDSASFVGVLSSFSHSGQVKSGCLGFNSMSQDHGITPTLDLCNSLVDLLGRAGHVKYAEDLLQIMPFKYNLVGWVSLLGNCRIHGNVEIASRCFDQILVMDGEKAAGYVLMSHVYAYAGMASNADKVEELRKCTRTWKIPGKALTEIDNNVHEFVVGDSGSSQIVGINAKMQRLIVEMKDQAYLPCLEGVLLSTFEFNDFMNFSAPLSSNSFS